MCLICGHVGCSRYGAGHAALHARESHHPFAMEADTQRVWDYVGDGYVHRLIASSADGKLVELPGADDSPAGGGGGERRHPVTEEKVEALALEFGAVLTTQLESQRLFYEQQLETVRPRPLH
jgi:BRCA1-associated protein